MVISILIPFLPVVVALAVFNILQMKMNGVLPYDYNKVHNHELPIPWSTVVLMPSSQISWALMVNCYIPILTSIPIFVFFGMTKDAINDYRRIALFFGLGVLFPSLRQMYDPDKSFTVGDSSFGSRQTQSTVWLVAILNPRYAHEITLLTLHLVHRQRQNCLALQCCLAIMLCSACRT